MKNFIKANVGYFAFSMLWLLEIWLISRDIVVLLTAPWWYWLLAGIGVVTAAHTISFYGVGNWFRKLVAREVPDSAGGKFDWEGKNTLGELICCPICAGAHAGTIILLVYTLDVAFGLALVMALFMASCAMFGHYIAQRIEWQGRYAIEESQALWLRKKYGDLKPLVDLWMADVQEDTVFTMKLEQLAKTEPFYKKDEF